MQLAERIEAFSKLGDEITGLRDTDLAPVFDEARKQNPWFVPEYVRLAFSGIKTWLTRHNLERWAASCPAPRSIANIGVVMAGNIPLVGFHDYLSVLIAGHHCIAKLSSKDPFLLRFLHEKLIRIEPGFSPSVSFAANMERPDAVIATGSDNTARYFDYNFRNLPRLIRRNRSSIAVLTGTESSQEMTALGLDVFSYFGFGCRNVSKLFVPEGFDINRLVDAWKAHAHVIDHPKYANNYHYQKARLHVNGDAFDDAGFVLLARSRELVSPVAVIFVESYRSREELLPRIDACREKTQCLVSIADFLPGAVLPGQAQFPGLTDYADGVDTLKFLSSLA